MGFVELLIVGVGLSMDAFAVSICKGLGMKRVNWAHAVVIAAFFGGFQALMPLLGWALGTQFAQFITPIDHWIAFGLLAFIGAKMLWDAFHEDDECGECDEGAAADISGECGGHSASDACVGRDEGGTGDESDACDECGGSDAIGQESVGVQSLEQGLHARTAKRDPCTQAAEQDLRNQAAKQGSCKQAVEHGLGDQAAIQRLDLCDQADKQRLDLRELLMLAVATSIDALAVGITFAFLGVNIWGAILVIGLTTFVLSFIGVAVGNQFGSRFEKPATIVGGIVLILIGVKILLEHLGVLVL